MGAAIRRKVLAEAKIENSRNTRSAMWEITDMSSAE